jgi:hypothetical protein
VTFTGFGNTSISVKVPDETTGTINIESGQNKLFSVDSNLQSGNLFSVSDQSNQSIFEVGSDGSTRISVQETVHVGGDGLVLPSYPTASLPTPEEGMLIYDRSVKIPKMYDGKQWVDLGTPDLSIPPTATLVTNSLVDGVFTTGMTNTTNGDVNGSYAYQGTINLGGCGSNNSAVFLRLKDTIPWRYITCYFEMTGTTACWGFMGGNRGYTEVTPSESNPNLIPGGNLEPYDPYQGDRIFGGGNSFDGNPRYKLQLSACDNSSDNFFRFNNYKSFWVTARRKPNGRLSGPFHSRSCNQTGVYIRISNIYIY